MSKKNSNRFIIQNRSDVSQIKYRKCAHHINSQKYVTNINQHDDIMENATSDIQLTDMNSTIRIKIIFHFMAPKGSYNRNKVLSRSHDIIQSINDDFNNYSVNSNTMNNLRYKGIINQVFLSNIPKQTVYLSAEYQSYLPTKPSNIIFEHGEIYYYPITERLNLVSYDDLKDVEIQYEIVKQYIFNNKAGAIYPDKFLNIWVMDMTDTSILGFSNFPWEAIDDYHGIIIHRRIFFPEDYMEKNFLNYKTITHHIGHYLGLLHVSNLYSDNGPQISNLNDEPLESYDLYQTKTNFKMDLSFDPLDTQNNKQLHGDAQYNPLFMNFMDYTYDKYVTMFTNNQMQKMRYMIYKFRPTINYELNKSNIPKARYNPDTDTLTGPAITPVVASVPAIEPISKVIIPDPEIQKKQANNYSTLAPNLFVNNLEPDFKGSSSEIIDNIKSTMTQELSTHTPKNPPKPEETYYSYNNYVNYYPTTYGYQHPYYYPMHNNYYQSMQQQSLPMQQSYMQQLPMQQQQLPMQQQQSPMQQSYMQQLPTQQQQPPMQQPPSVQQQQLATQQPQVLNDRINQVNDQLNNMNQSRAQTNPQINNARYIARSSVKNDMFNAGKIKCGVVCRSKNFVRSQPLINKN